MFILDSLFIHQTQFSKQSDWHTRTHYHLKNQHEIHYFLSEKGYFINGDTRMKISPGLGCYTPPLMTHKIYPENFNEAVYYYAILLHVDEEDNTVQDLLRFFDPKKAQKLTNQYRLLFEQIISDTKTNPQQANQRLLRFLLDLALPHENPNKTNKDERIETILSYMHTNLYEKIELSEMADYLALSPSYFSRYFKSMMGISPMRYFMNLKLDVGKKMLEETDITIKEVAFKLCFHDEFHFSHQFKDCFGHSPKKSLRKYSL